MTAQNNADSTITTCSFTGTVTGTAASLVGGVVGSNTGTVTNCYSTADVSGSGLGVGGVMASSSGTVEKSVALNKIVITTFINNTYLGRVVGSTTSSPTMTGNYARSTGMTIAYNNGTAYAPTSNANGKDGADITDAQWNSAGDLATTNDTIRVLNGVVQ